MSDFKDEIDQRLRILDEVRTKVLTEGLSKTDNEMTLGYKIMSALSEYKINFPTRYIIIFQAEDRESSSAEEILNNSNFFDLYTFIGYMIQDHGYNLQSIYESLNIDLSDIVPYYSHHSVRNGKSAGDVIKEINDFVRSQEFKEFKAITDIYDLQTRRMIFENKVSDYFRIDT